MLNKTNNRTSAGAFGDDCDGWKGKIIVVFPTTAEFRGRMVPALRVRIPPPKEGKGQRCSEAEAASAAAGPTELLDDELPTNWMF